MPFAQWHNQVIKKVGPISEKTLYLRTAVFSLFLFAGVYGYTTWLNIPNVLNKSIADTSIILIGLSMMMSSLCYFWNFVDTKIVYRKHLGLVGFAYALIHVGLSWSALKNLVNSTAWQTGTVWPVASATAATLIFLIMALVSNKYAAIQLGGKWWRAILRTGYVGIALVWAHVFLLKSARWVTWYASGMKTLPSMSLLVAVFMLVVMVMRIALWWALVLKERKTR